jgi:menaquinone-specific isochorismate synthase
MSTDPSAILDWLESGFFKLGAFITGFDGDQVILAKGGVVSETEFFSAEESFYLKDFYQDKYLTLLPAQILRTNLKTLKDVTAQWTGSKFTSEITNEDAAYRSDFEDLKIAFNENLRKVVLVSRENYESIPSEERIRHLFSRAIHFGTGLPYGFWYSAYGIIGSTPETLYSIKGSRLSTFALAGTAKVGEEELLLQSKKDREEHNLVIKDIEEKLGPFSVEVRTSETKILPFKKIVHLKTDIQATLKPDTDLKALTNSLSPTAALGGYPKTLALNFLQASRYAHKHPSRYFGSAMGLISQDFSQFVVMIRNVQWNQQHFFIESGGGVLADSELEKELQEIRLKRETVKEHYFP